VSCSAETVFKIETNAYAHNSDLVSKENFGIGGNKIGFNYGKHIHEYAI
jgi:hypothetical protein